MKPTAIEKNFKKLNLSSLVKKGDKINVNIGATESNKAVVFDWIYCSDQLINTKGIMFPIMPMNMINTKSFNDIENLYFL